MVKSLLVHFPEIGRLKDEGGNTPLNLFVCKSVMKGVSWGLLFLWLGVISCCLFACQQKEEANAELAKLQTTSFITAGVAIFIKSWNRIPDFAKKYLIRNLTSELLNE